MNKVNGHKPLLLAALISTLTFSYATASVAADADPAKHSWQDRMGLESYEQQREALEESLSSATTVEALRAGLQKAGYRLTAINQESDSDVEYEVVKGDHTFEVQADIADGKLKDIDVSNNIWRADSTKRALKEADYDASDVKYDKEHAGRYSDAQFADTWTKEKAALLEAMPIGKKYDDYKQILEAKGYQVTSVNDVDDDNVEFEIVKGEHSFEVNLDRDKDTKVVEEIEVTNNIWQSEETEKALGKE